MALAGGALALPILAAWLVRGWAMTDPSPARWALRVSGVVQGVGFRPFVWGLANALGLSGFVGNDDAGVFIEVEGPQSTLEQFRARLASQAPALARVDSLHVSVVPPQLSASGKGYGFAIVPSRDLGAGVVSPIPPDTAVCGECLAELRDPRNRRYRYPFIACTHCGPRYTIVTGLPYDRPFTTMAGFPLCRLCRAEYEDPADRRFHAQPTACPECGPQVWFRAGTDPPGARTAESEDALALARRVIGDGGNLTIKGIGGYHIACDATRSDVVARLRSLKGRGNKPFAVMVADLAAAERLVELGGHARALLAAPQAPIVLAPAAHSAHALGIADSVAPGNGHIGVMLPYTPLHHLLLAGRPDDVGAEFTALVMTSGNLADEPICTQPEQAEHALAGIVDAWLHHDRPIHVACDDSVVRVAGTQVLPVRRSRGYAPVPVTLPMSAPAILAVGGELKTTLALAAGNRAWLSQHIGDTQNLETLDQLAGTATTLADLTRISPEVIVADTHPDYLSRGWAQQRSRELGVRFETVQHHHAHLASLLAEWAIPVGEPVLGVVFDGTGYGRDATIWGGELLLGSYAEVSRVGFVRPISLPGGDTAIRRPTRTALAHLHAAGLDWDPDLAPVMAASAVELGVIGRMLATKAGCVPTTSMGRVFDAIASLLGVCQDIGYEGQAAIELEALAARAPRVADRSWAWSITGSADAEDPLVLSPQGSLASAIAATRSGVPVGIAARAFHEAVVEVVVAAAGMVRRAHGTTTVGLTGGVFQNVLLAQGCQRRLGAAGFRVLTHRVVPPNDGGLALGQVAVAAAR